MLFCVVLSPPVKVRISHNHRGIRVLPVGAAIALRNPILAILAGLWVLLLRNRMGHSATGQSVPTEGGKDKGRGQAGRTRPRSEGGYSRGCSSRSRRAVRKWRRDGGNGGEAAASVPHLPAELWARIHQQGRIEAAQPAAWVAWEDATLMQLVVIWFRTGGQRSAKWLGNLIGANGGIASGSTDNIASRFTPWCKAILRPGEENEPLHYSGSDGAPATIVNVYVHMISMMNYPGFHNVIDCTPPGGTSTSSTSSTSDER